MQLERGFSSFGDVGEDVGDEAPLGHCRAILDSREQTRGGGAMLLDGPTEPVRRPTVPWIINPADQVEDCVLDTDPRRTSAGLPERQPRSSAAELPVALVDPSDAVVDLDEYGIRLFIEKTVQPGRCQTG